MLSELPGFLTWSAGIELLDIVCDFYRDWVYQRLRSWSANCPELLQALTALPEENQQRLIRSPQVCFLLRSREISTQADASVMMALIEAEEYLCGRREHMTHNTGSALGDYYFLHSKPRGTLQVVQSPSVHHIAIDVFDSRSQACWPPDCGARERYTKPEIAALRDRIGMGFDQVKSINATAARMVQKSIHVLGIMKLLDRPGECCSASTKMMIGAAVLGNFHEPKWAIGKLTDALVHEGIHQLIYKLELESALYTDYAAALRLVVTSPWTGRTLQLESFIHAVFVWFGLLNFWNASSLDGPEFSEFRNLAASGFRKGPLTSFLSPELRSYVKPEVVLAIAEIWERAAFDAA
jgi:hypothetical protein